MQNTGIGLVLLGLVFGALVWILIVWYKPAISVRQILRLVILTGLFGHLILAFVTPTFFAPDEQPHFKYVQYLAVHTSFPIQDSATDAPTNDWEYYQPPIYYIVSVPIYWLVDGLSDGNVYVTVRALRLFSIALWGVTLWITLLVLSRLRITDSFLLVFIVGMVSLLPAYTFLSSSINNDNLLITISSLLLLMLVKGLTSPQKALYFGVVVGIALLVKLTAVIFLVAAFFWLVIQSHKRRISLPAATGRMAFIIVPAVALFAPWAVRSLVLYGDVTGESIADIPAHWSSLIGGILSSYNLMAETFWSAYGVFNETRFVPRVGVVVIAFSLIGYLSLLTYKKQSIHLIFLDTGNSFLLVMLVTLIVQIILVFRFGLLYGQGQGRFLYPLLIPIALLMAIGLAGLLKQYMGIERFKRVAYLHAAGFLVAYLAGYIVYSLGALT